MVGNFFKFLFYSLVQAEELMKDQVGFEGKRIQLAGVFFLQETEGKKSER